MLALDAEVRAVHDIDRDAAMHLVAAAVAVYLVRVRVRVRVRVHLSLLPSP